MKQTVGIEDIKEVEPSFTESVDGNVTRFICKIGTQDVGNITATLVKDNVYEVNALFVDPAQRGKGIGSSLVKQMNQFLEKHNALGKLINTVKGDSAGIYENNGWKKGNYQSHNAYGGYEYTYNGNGAFRETSPTDLLDKMGQVPALKHILSVRKEELGKDGNQSNKSKLEEEIEKLEAEILEKEGEYF